MNQRTILRSVVTGACALAASALASIGAASANVIQIADNSGTITCSGGVDPACLAFAFGASGGLGTEPDGAGTLIDGNPNTEVAWYYDGVPSSESHEASRLNILSGGATSFTMADAVRDNAPSMSFSTLAEYVVLKLGNMAVFIKNNTGGELMISLSNLAMSFGLSHVTEFGQVSDIPIPGAIWLMIAGIAGLGAAGRKKKAL